MPISPPSRRSSWPGERGTGIFERSVELRAGVEPWVFYEGPPTANGRPGLHHVWARVYKDLFCRYRTMRGYAVPRKAGWDTHGLPVEVEVEKQLGITAKRQIETDVGIAEFTRLCRESVRNYVGEWKSLTERIGYWIDIDDAYWTFTPEYVESVWANLKSLWDQGLLDEDIKVVPDCRAPRTALSSHELGQPDVYQEVEDESAYVRFPLTDDGDAAARLATSLGRPSLDGLALLAWTTTPWTLLSNTGAAVGPDLEYAVVGDAVVAVPLVARVFGEGVTADAVVSGSALVGLSYLRPFDDVAPSPPMPAGSAGGWWPATSSRPTRGRHRPPRPGLRGGRPPGGSPGRPADPQSGRARRTLHRCGAVAGGPVGARDERGGQRSPGGRRPAVPPPFLRPLLSPLLALQHAAHLLGQAELVHPDLGAQGRPRGPEPDDQLAPRAHPEGRMGEWLANNVDWALSRDRFWGTPLPVWRCDEGHTRCVGSLSELSELCGTDVTDVDPHRPTIDEVAFPCPDCADGAVMRRVEPVIDAWFDSGSMPTAQWGYRGVPGRPKSFVFPADFICEAIDQTRLGSCCCWPSTPWSGGPRPTGTSCAWATSSMPTAARCPRAWATSSTPGRSSPPGGRTRCGGGCSRRARRGPRPG